MSGTGWAICQTYGAQERKALVNLERQGFEAFCPLFSRPSKSNIRVNVESPLFPCYLFVKIDPLSPWQSINYTLGVIRLLTDRNPVDPRPLFVLDSKIADIQALTKTAEEPFPPGTQVRVRTRDSSFHDQVGTVVRMDKAMRVQVLMSFFNRDVVVTFENPAELESI